MRKLTVGAGGYLYCTMFDVSGRMRSIRVHCAVLEAFVGPRPSGMHACHNDGNKLNIRLSNLRWDTAASNNADKLRHGTHQSGSKNPSAKLTEENVKQIKKRLFAGETLSSLGREFGVTTSQIWHIKNGLKWGNVLP